jgi:UDP-N-acetylmuramate dehydrogenase
MRSAFGDGRLRAGVPLAPLTTFRVGGPAEWLIETRNSREMETALSIARAYAVPVTVIGGGSNVLFSVAGIVGMVFR